MTVSKYESTIPRRDAPELCVQLRDGAEPTSYDVSVISRTPPVKVGLYACGGNRSRLTNSACRPVPVLEKIDFS